MRLFLFITCCIASFAGCSQQPLWRFIPRTDSQTLPLGDTTITVNRYRYGNAAAPFFLHLHHNEQTADSILHDFLSLQGGTAIGIQNNRQRFVSFKLADFRYRFDPNRMFTPGGIQRSLQLLSKYQLEAAAAVALFADTLLGWLPRTVPVIAMHNNTNGSYSLLDYTTGGLLAAEAKAVFRSPEMDSDDFVLTTNRDLFSYLKQSGINAILQDNSRAADDGSLGYLLGRQGWFYVNIEAEHGHGAQQAALVQAVVGFLERNQTSE